MAYADSVMATEAEAGVLAAHRRPILLVEDDDVDAEALQRAIRKAGIANPLILAADGQEALETLDGRTGMPPEQPCVVLLDINMPRMNGIEFLRAMRGKDAMKGNVVFLLTTSGRPQDKAAAYDLQAAGYVLKENLGAFVDVLARYCAVNEFP
jgi:CheY-like chemotaxis protein